MNKKYIFIVLYSTALYMIYNSNNYYVEKVKNYIFSNVERLYNIQNVRQTPDDGNHRLFTVQELSKFTNVDTGLYLSILGKIYDVTNGAKFYGPGGSYNGFVGRDASLAFITGDFSEGGLTDDLSSLSDKQVIQLVEWASFYDTNYLYKGKLVGRYYDKNGQPTHEYKNILEKSERGKIVKIKEEEKNVAFPPCNIEWKADSGSRVWCTKNSGGISRDWVGVPRILFEKPNSKQNRCACVNVKSKEYIENKANFEVYKGCSEGATSCIIKT